jgi:hypothetical protein
MLACACSSAGPTGERDSLSLAPTAGVGSADTPAATEHRPVEARLGAQGDELAVTLRNYSEQSTRVSLELRIDTPEGAFVNEEIEQLELRAGEERRVTLPPVEGADRNAAWARVSLRYGFSLASGASAKQLTELALRAGVVVPREEALATGRQLPDVVLEESETLIPKAGTPFTACFRNSLSFLARVGTSGPVPLTQVDLLQENNPILPLPGQMYEYRAPDGAVGSGLLDSNGCTSSLARQTGSWTFKLYLYAERTSPGRGAYYQTDAGTLPFKQEVITVAATGNPTRRDFQAAAADRPYQAALFLANHTIERANGIRAVKLSGRNLLRISPVTGTGTAFYCHNTGVNCTTPKTLRLSSDVANERGLVAHETGHFIHNTHHTVTFNKSYAYSNADAGNPSDSCIRNPTGHVTESVEWQSAAHLEGLADFFAALAYNNYSSSDRNCQLPSWIGFGVQVAILDCESLGESLSRCAEWTNGTLFNKTGNEMDWTKMYWDFLTDHGGSVELLMAAEASVQSWPATGNHYDLFHAFLNATQKAKLNAAAAGNIWDGSAQ